MKAVQYRAVGAAPEVVTVPDPEPGPGQVLLKVTAAGVCHSDIAVMSWPADQIPFPLPLTLGHEGVGTVAALGDGVHGLSEGDSVAVYGPWGCGICVNCAEGKENYCLRAKELGIMPPGLGAPGAMAEYMIVDDPRHLVPIGDLDPVKTVSLTDAGLTPYHAIKRSLPKLVPGATAVVIGTGGLGHVAIQLLRAMTAARVIALDVTEEKLDLARAVGAHEAVLSDEKAAARVKELTGDSARTSCWTSSAPRPPWRPPGRRPGRRRRHHRRHRRRRAPGRLRNAAVRHERQRPYWGSRKELAEVLDLAHAGAVDVHVETYSIDEAPLAYERLHDGRINGRAVILPNG